MTIIHQWTLTLAETVAPDEVYLAPSLADSYIAAYQNPSQMETFSTTEPIGSTCEPCDMHLLLPAVIHGINQASHELIAILSSDTATSILTLTALLLEIKESTLDKWKEQEKEDLLDYMLKAKAISIQVGAEHPAEKAALDNAIDSIGQATEQTGVPKEVAELTAVTAVHKLLSAPKSGLSFLRALKR